MNLNDHRTLKHAARDIIDNTPNQKKLVSLWLAVGILLPLFVSALEFFLSEQIEGTSGLSGMGLRSILSTVQTTLSFLRTILLPFWNLGYTAVILCFSRQQATDSRTLLEGFHRFGLILRTLVLRAFLCTAVAMVAMYAGIIVLSLSPMAESINTFIAQNQEVFVSGVWDESMLIAMSDLYPVMVILWAVTLAALIPTLYRLRLTDFCVMDAPHRMAMLVIRRSRFLMRGNCLKLFRLDLSFWWFYLAQILLTALCYGDLILPLFGVTFPFSAETAFFVFYIISLLLQFALLYRFSNLVQTTYALFYNTLNTPPANAPQAEISTNSSEEI